MSSIRPKTQKKAGLTWTSQQDIYGLGPFFQLISIIIPLPTVTHLTPLMHEYKARPSLFSTTIQEKMVTESRGVSEEMVAKITLSLK